MVRENGEEVAQYGRIAFNQGKQTLPADDPQPALRVGDDRYREGVLRGEEECRGQHVGSRQGIEREFAPLFVGHLHADAPLAQQQQRTADAVLHGDEFAFAVVGDTRGRFLENRIDKRAVATPKQGHVVKFTFHMILICRLLCRSVTNVTPRSVSCL